LVDVQSPEAPPTTKLLPSGTLPVAVGLIVSGMGAYGFLVISARALGPSRYSDLSVLWALSYIVGPGLFLPLEQEISRALSARRAQGLDEGGILKRGALLGGAFAAMISGVALALNQPIAAALFHGNSLLAAALSLSLFSYFAHHLVRGALSGRGSFSRFGSVVAGDGALRLIAAGALALAGAATGAYGLVIAITPIAATLIVARDISINRDAAQVSWRELTSSLGYLLAASLLGQFLLNAGPVAVRLLATEGERAEAGKFLAGVVIARVPLSLFQAVQVALLPNLSSLVAAGRRAELRRSVLRLASALLGFGVIVSVASYIVGPQVVAAIFGQGFDIEREHLFFLASGSCAFMLAVALGQAAVADTAQGRVALGWLFGATIFLLVAASGGELIERVATAYMAGAIATALAMAGLLAARLRRV
jgi:O-antigen/teichoic acid export membrane protein